MTMSLLVAGVLRGGQLLQGLADDAQRLLKFCLGDDQRRSESDYVPVGWFGLSRVSPHT